MKLYFAPLEGITTFTYRNTHEAVFGHCDEYFAPFIAPSENERVTRKTMKDILPENNSNVNLKVQVLTNKSEAFNKFVSKIKEIGYNHINLNLGCPSGTVVNKGRGAGFLRYPAELDKFLHEIFENSEINISIKTRIGFSSSDEMQGLLEIYNKYNIDKLIVHPRVREEFYKGYPDYDTFKNVYKNSKNTICYNGNIFTVEDYNFIKEKFPDIDSVMIGRGAVMNPAIFREIKGGKKITSSELKEFTYRLADNYNNILDSDVFTLHKLKEIWIYTMDNFPNCKKTAKALKKSNKLSEFLNAVESLPEIEYN